MRHKTIGLILAYNAEKTLENLHHKLPADVFSEVILADDASSDKTIELADRLGIKTFTHPHAGYGGNLKFGLKKALELGADYIIEIHGDDQYDPIASSSALEKLRAGSDLVLGSRFTGATNPLKDGMPMIKYLANRVLSIIDRLVLNLPLTEFHTGFRGFSRRFLDTTNFMNWSDDYLFDFQTIIAAKVLGFTVSEVPVRCLYHKDARSINLWRSTVYAFQTFFLLAKYLFNKKSAG